MMPALASITDQIVAGIGPQVGSGSLADAAIVVARNIDAKVTLNFVSVMWSNRLHCTHKTPVPKTRQTPSFSVRPIVSLRMTGKGMMSNTKSVRICIVAYDIHQGSFLRNESALKIRGEQFRWPTLKHRKPGMLLSQNAETGVHWKIVAMMKARLDTTIHAFITWQAFRNEVLETAKIR